MRGKSWKKVADEQWQSMTQAYQDNWADQGEWEDLKNRTMR